MAISLSASIRSLGPPISIDIFFYVPYNYASASKKLSLHSLRKRRHHLDAHFFGQAYRGLKSCTSLSEYDGLAVPPCNLKDFSQFGISPSNKHCPSARCAYAADAVGESLHIFVIGAVSLNHIYTHQPKIVNNTCS
jgi:hypothetical protein